MPSSRPGKFRKKGNFVWGLRKSGNFMIMVNSQPPEGGFWGEKKNGGQTMADKRKIQNLFNLKSLPEVVQSGVVC